METTFQDLGLSEALLQSLNEAGYTHPTPIQAKAIPAVLMMRDVMGCAQTGTGKTASFTLPMIDVLAEGQGRAKMPRSLILSPTRELAAQIAENFEKYTVNHNLKMALLIGGESMKDQGEVLNKGVDVLIATPGRMLDLFERGAIILNDVKIFVIDEADRMLDMGFIPDIETIVSKLPGNRQTLMFSATMPPEIRKLAEKFLDNPKEITVAPPSTTASTVDARILYCGPKQKRENLRKLLEQDPPESAILFCNRKRDIGVLVRSLKRHGYSAGELHGDLSQPVRMETLDKFKSGDITLLVCSDVAARGIDVATVSHVFNMDVPNHPEDYVHRIGRTGRAGREGKAVMFATGNDDKSVAAIEQIIGKSIAAVEGFEKSTLDAPQEASADKPSKANGRQANTTRENREGREGSRRGKGRNGGTGNEDVAIHKPIAVNMAAWADFVDDDVVRAGKVFEGMIPAFLLRRKNAPGIPSVEESDAEAAQVSDEPVAQADTDKGEDDPKQKPKRKRAPRKRKPKSDTKAAEDKADAKPQETDNNVTAEAAGTPADAPDSSESTPPKNHAQAEPATTALPDEPADTAPQIVVIEADAETETQAQTATQATAETEVKGKATAESDEQQNEADEQR